MLGVDLAGAAAEVAYPLSSLTSDKIGNAAIGANQLAIHIAPQVKEPEDLAASKQMRPHSLSVARALESAICSNVLMASCKNSIMKRKISEADPSKE